MWLVRAKNVRAVAAGRGNVAGCIREIRSAESAQVDRSGCLLDTAPNRSWNAVGFGAKRNHISVTANRFFPSGAFLPIKSHLAASAAAVVAIARGSAAYTARTARSCPVAAAPCLCAVPPDPPDQHT